jgi:D-cysteine desulfhydrase
LGAALRLTDLWCKRDDLTDVAAGGNKLRKLEFLLADARSRGADAVVTYGKLQSNHARCTAAAAARCGLRCTIIYQEEEPKSWSGNLALAALLGAETRFIGSADAMATNAHVRRVVEEYAAAGLFAYPIPEGGGDAVGALGFVYAAAEIEVQCRSSSDGRPPDVIVIAAGSGGSLAGLALGLRRYLPETRLLAISVGPSSEAIAKRAAQIANAAARLAAWDQRFTPRDFSVLTDWVGDGYGLTTPPGEAALLLAARSEGLLLDPVYTSKAMAAVSTLAARGEFKATSRVVFWHTGGTPGLFANGLWLDQVSRKDLWSISRGKEV